MIRAPEKTHEFFESCIFLFEVYLYFTQNIYQSALKLQGIFQICIHVNMVDFVIKDR